MAKRGFDSDGVSGRLIIITMIMIIMIIMMMTSPEPGACPIIRGSGARAPGRDPGSLGGLPVPGLPGSGADRVEKFAMARGTV